MIATVEPVIVCDKAQPSGRLRFEVGLEENPQFDGKEEAERVAAVLSQDLHEAQKS